MPLLNKPRRSRFVIGSAVLEATHEELYRARGISRPVQVSNPGACFFSLHSFLFHPSALSACLFLFLFPFSVFCFISFLFASFGLRQSCKSRINFFFFFYIFINSNIISTMASSTSTTAAIAATIDEFSFMFADIPLQLHDSPANNKKYYPSHPHQDFIIEVNERLEAWNECTYPPLSAGSEPSPSARLSRTIDRSNPYDIYGPSTDESATPTHALFLSDDSDYSGVFSSPATSNGTPTTSKFQTIPLQAPYMDRVPPPAYREAAENPYSAYSNTTRSRPCYIPFEYAKLPHFHPPRFSQRLRMLIAERRRPMTLHLHEPYANEKQAWAATTPDSSLLPTPRNALRTWWANPDSKLMVFASLMTMLLGVFIITLVLARLWKW